MALDSDGTTIQYVNYGNIITGVAEKLIMFWVYLDVAQDGTVFIKGTTNGWSAAFGTASSSIYMFFRNYFSTNVGIWRNGTAFSSGWYHVAIHYDWSSASNDPRMWVNNVLQTITEVVTPSGSNSEGTSDLIVLGNLGAQMNGRIHSLTIQNVGALSDSEIAEIVSNAYNSRLLIPSMNGLVFAPMLWGAAGGKKDGETLAAGNTIRDLVTGTDGVPSGSPIFKDETILSLGGE